MSEEFSVDEPSRDKISCVHHLDYGALTYGEIEKALNTMYSKCQSALESLRGVEGDGTSDNFCIGQAKNHLLDAIETASAAPEPPTK